MKILITAFDPFGDEEKNAASEAVFSLPDRIDEAELVKLQVPTVYGLCMEALRPTLEKEKPDAILCVGQAGGRAEITPERIAVNIADARIKDNAGNKPNGERIREDGPAAYFSTLPIKRMVQRLKDAGIPASVSNSAGTFVCNNLMFLVLDYLAQINSSIPAGFVHVPYLSSQTEGKTMPSLPDETVNQGLIIIVRTIAELSDRGIE